MKRIITIDYNDYEVPDSINTADLLDLAETLCMLKTNNEWTARVTVKIMFEDKRGHSIDGSSFH